VSHLHIIEGALPLTMIALQCIYPQLEVSFGFGKKLRLARISSFEVGEL
jgi:hypothetical protein